MTVPEHMCKRCTRGLLPSAVQFQDTWPVAITITLCEECTGLVCDAIEPLYAELGSLADLRAKLGKAVADELVWRRTDEVLAHLRPATPPHPPTVDEFGYQIHEGGEQ